MKLKNLSLISVLVFGFATAAHAQQLAKIPSNFNTAVWARATEHPPEMNFPRPFGQIPVGCSFSHLRYDDPIAQPGMFKQSPLHVFFGNRLTNANSTYSTLRSDGEGTCFGGPVNRSAMYIPSMMNASNKVVLPDFIDVYYRGNPSTRAFPRGLKMIFGYDLGSPNAYNWEFTTPRYAWSFGDIGEWRPPKDTSGTYHFQTLTPDAYPSWAWQNKSYRISARAISPNCWDGQNLDSSNHRSHLAYSANDGTLGVTCPMSHPVRIPQATVTAYYSFIDQNDVKGWYLTSDRASGRNLPAGTNFYVGFIPAWDDDIMNSWVTNILNSMKYGAFGKIDNQRILDKPPTSKTFSVTNDPKVKVPYFLWSLRTSNFPYGLPNAYNNIAEPPTR